jgi:hypothetical protein
MKKATLIRSANLALALQNLYEDIERANVTRRGKTFLVEPDLIERLGNASIDATELVRELRGTAPDP